MRALMQEQEQENQVQDSALNAAAPLIAERLVATLLERRGRVFEAKHGKSVAEYIAEQQTKDPTYTGEYLLDDLYIVVENNYDDDGGIIEQLHQYRTDDLGDALAEYVRLNACDILEYQPESPEGIYPYQEMGSVRIGEMLQFLGLCGDRVRKVSEPC